ncbi:MAG: type II toxin-antitoxin system YafQ family toxin [Ignavibacteria bacterium]|nr:type II toxin-antitoxin system YafQ family toxin [Ignavibacteria bacterium]
MRLIYSSQFKKDFKKIQSQGKDIHLLETIVEILLKNQPLEPKYRDHKLAGKWQNHRDCHIKPDWLLIYRLIDDALYLERTGSHSELFK